jgi:hypothetical protein
MEFLFKFQPELQPLFSLQAAAYFPYLAIRALSRHSVSYLLGVGSVAQRTIVSELKYRVRCLSIAYPVGKFCLTDADDSLLTLIPKL